MAVGGYPEGKATSDHNVGIVEVLGHNSALMGFHNGSAQIKANAHALCFCRKEGLIKPFHHLRWQASPCVSD